MSDCWMMNALRAERVAIVYVHVPNSEHYLKLSQRFVRTYVQHSPEYDHRTIIVSNGGSPQATLDELFSDLPRKQFLVHDNSGKDIGAFQKAAREVPCEIMVFFGASTYFRRKGWLNRMVEAYDKHGPTLYGATGNRGVPQIGVYPHIRTTAFWMPPSLFNQYPLKVTKDEQRYPFEHGRSCLTDWISRMGGVPLVVSWQGEHTWENWDSIPNGYHQGDQGNVLVGDRLTEPPHWHTA